eukprot:CAMPEP_0179410304 /NCGR_PEP_ID=MMETSP0799-20121207/3210_1 /TAXON_ID=46947 /ORGANISM="Geminigera cryophila, Strain CCMP2564" /LENGTH=114 /DNA_ID=CAMNT_0021182133 /DNA_START=273 /DNA_END=613 /DNA_ORIENTATION=+
MSFEEGIKSETLFLTINLFDRLLAKKSVTSEKTRLVAVAALLIASKHEELAPQGVQTLVFRADSTCEEVLAMEAWVLREVDYNLTMITPLRALEFVRISVVLDPLFFSQSLHSG